MGLFRKNTVREQETQVTPYESSFRERGSVSYTSENVSNETVNLCRRESGGLSVSRICIIVAVVLALLLIVEFFGIYRPYRALEEKEAELAQLQTQAGNLFGSTLDMEAVREEYRKYNYENFPAEIVDREEVLKLLEDTVFERGKITHFSISGNSLEITVSDIASSEIEEMMDEIEGSALVDRLNRRTVADGATVVLTILFKDATEGN